MTAVVKGLQNSINRFYGVTLGAPITVDGAVGQQTLSAINGIVEWMPGAGYDTALIVSLLGQPVTTANVSMNAAVISNALDWLADDNEFTTGVTPNPPSVPVVQTSAGKIPTVPLALIPRGKSQISASVLGLGLPAWAVYGGGAALALTVVMLIVRRKSTSTADYSA